MSAPRPRGGAALAGAGGALYPLVFPPFDLHALAWVACVPLLLSLRGAPGLGAGLARGWLFGAAATLAATWWSTPSLVVGFGLAAPVAVGATAATMVVYGAFFGVFGTLVVALRGGWLPFVLAVPVAWTLSELLRAHALGGLPWLLLGHSQHAALPVLQLAEVGGVVGISAVLALANALACLAVEAAWRGERRRALVALALFAAVPLAAWGAGAARLAAWESGGEEAGDAAPIGVVQAALPQAERWTEAFRRRNLERHLELTREAVARGARIVVWGETAIDFELRERPELPGEIAAALGGDPGRQVVTGLPRTERRDGRVVRRNSVAVFDGAGRMAAVYDKVRLLPFAESDPAWVDFVPLLRSALGPVMEGDPYLPGQSSAPLPTAAGPVGALVCFESIYPGLSRATVRAGAEILVNVTNDGFLFGRAAKEQHLAQTVIRAVETRRPLLRAANRGIGAVVAPTGRVTATLPPATPAVHVAEITPRSGPTPFVRWGWALPWTLPPLALAGCIRGRS